MASESLQLVALDLDGTVFRSDLSISARTMAVLERCLVQGIHLCVATARPPCLIEGLVPPLFHEIPWIAHSGALAVYKGKILFQDFLSAPDLHAMAGVAHFFSPPLMVCTEYRGRLVCTRDVSDLWPNFEVVDFRHLEPDSVPKFVVGLDGVDVDFLREHIPSDAELVISDGGTLGQIHRKHLSKSTGVARLMELWNLEWSQVCAFGDDIPDIPLLRDARWGVAMANSVPEVLAVTPYHTASNDEDGVAIFLENLLEGKMSTLRRRKTTPPSPLP